MTGVILPIANSLPALMARWGGGRLKGAPSMLAIFFDWLPYMHEAAS